MTLITTDWSVASETVEKHVVLIHTPTGYGTGFFIAETPAGGMCVVATAAHVVEHANLWEEPIRLEHKPSGTFALLRPADRAMVVLKQFDSAAIFFQRSLLTSLPEVPLNMIPAEKRLRTGNEVGWLGFPEISGGELCFFTGRISAWIAPQQQYFVDGVAIHGVSGGPAFCAENPLWVIGIVSAYVANRRATGETLPGLCSIRNVVQFQALSKTFRDVADAQRKAAEAAAAIEARADVAVAAAAAPAPEVTV